MYDYPTGRPDTIEFRSRRQNPDYWLSRSLANPWFPDAFVGPMASLMIAIEDGGEPETSGADNLKTLQLVQAAYRSMIEKRSIRPEEIGE
jgi:predicted dehydrogenase